MALCNVALLTRNRLVICPHVMRQQGEGGSWGPMSCRGLLPAKSQKIAKKTQFQMVSVALTQFSFSFAWFSGREACARCKGGGGAPEWRRSDVISFCI